ncbi:MAG: ExsB family transcriptional regulator [Candidatus Aenigmarchaeota archaeon]|nr:ExsB family transcriptional regulator [Candidatus Aenigmarchaeota archaeon]
MEIKEITLEELDTEKFIEEKVGYISSVVGNGYAINALSGGVDSAVVTMLGHSALGDRLITYIVENGIMREGEVDGVYSIFDDLGVNVKIYYAKDQFFGALKGLEDPEEKREAITQTFYKDIFGKLVKESGAKHLLQGTNLTDVRETVAGIKRQHNVLKQLGIDTQKEYGYKVIEPLVELRKPAIRKVGEALKLPIEIYNKPPFPGPALATRIIGEVTPERVETVRKATTIVEEELTDKGAFQYLAILHEDRVTGMREGKRDFGQEIQIRCWDSKDAKTGRPTELSWYTLDIMAERITEEVPGVVNVTYSITKKPPSTIEAI